MCFHRFKFLDFDCTGDNRIAVNYLNYILLRGVVKNEEQGCSGCHEDWSQPGNPGSPALGTAWV